jgi:Na+-transporting methylmalonyl-CoA/oxaloacetate decarboxylase gamma subunit
LALWNTLLIRITASIYKVSHGIAILFVFLFLLIAIEITVSAVDNIMFQLLNEEQKKKLAVSSAVSYKDSEWFKI